jgi:uncharacterized membrane protein
MKKLDGPTKKLVIPELMPRALWYFRWGAVVTVLVGFSYFAMYIVAPNARNAGESPGAWLAVWLLVVLVLYVFLYGALQKVNNGNVIAIVVGMLVVVLAILMLRLFPHADNKTFSIGVGGGIGVWMLLNVWGIIWRAQKKIIAATIEGTPPPADLARKAFLASRTNAWLSLPMLFLMGSSHGDYIILAAASCAPLSVPRFLTWFLARGRPKIRRLRTGALGPGFCFPIYDRWPEYCEFKEWTRNQGRRNL